MNSALSPEFIRLFRKLPPRIQATAKKNYELWAENHNHPSLQFKTLNTSPKRFSIRVGIGYRALGEIIDDGVIWVWIGSHADYDKINAK